MTGYSAEELKSMSAKELDDPEKSPQYIPEIMKQLNEKGSVKFEAVQIRKNGDPIHVEVNTKVKTIGGDDFIVSVCREINRIEKKLKATWRRATRFSMRPVAWQGWVDGNWMLKHLS